jgi:hypothetical protein
MDKQQWQRLNEILLEVSARNRPIDDLDEIPGWFEGSPDDVIAKVQEVRVLFDDAYDHGLVNRWVDERTRRGPSINWDWTTTAHRTASEMGMTLADPLGMPSLFANPPTRISTVIESILPTTLTCLAEEPFQHCEAVYERQVRFVVSHGGKPVAALVSLLDLELAKDFQLQVDPCRWVEVIQNLRERLGWPPVTFNNDEENSEC